MDEEKQRRENLVDRINSAYNIYQNLRTVQSLAKKAQAQLAQKAGAILATSEVWGPIAIAIGAIFIFVVIIVVITGGPAAGGTIPNPSPNPSPVVDITGAIIITGGTAEDVQTVNSALSLAFSYPGYKKLFTNGGVVNLVFEKDLVWEGTPVNGLVLSPNKIQLRSGMPSEKLKYSFLHETGHVTDWRNPRLGYPYDQLLEEDKSCYSFLGYLITYPFAETGGGGTPRAESFAESVSIFLNPRSPLLNFSMQCPNTQTWFFENVFRGTSSLQ